MKARKNKGGFFVSVTCPGCGGELDLDSNFFVLDCKHCGSVHRILMPDRPAAFLAPIRANISEARFAIDRHLKERGLPLTGAGLFFKKLYYPYWKIDAVLFKVRNRIERRVVTIEDDYATDASFEKEQTEISLTPYMTTIPGGCDMNGIPHSIGIRAEYIKMVPFADAELDDEFDPLPVTRSWESVREALLKRADALGNIIQADFGINRTEIFYPKASLVYFPYYVVESYPGKDYNRFVVDAVTGRLEQHVTRKPDSESMAYTDPVGYEPGELKIVPHRCGNCGVDLPKDHSYVYICPNCEQLAVLDIRSNLSEVAFVETPAPSKDRLFPFWSFGVSGEQMNDLKRIFGGIYSSDRLVIPAFEVRNFDAVCRLAKRISAAHPKLELRTVDQFDNRFMPVRVNSDEALMLADIFIHRERYSSAGRAGTDDPFRPRDIQLFYAPFHLESYFYVDSVLNAVTFEKQLVD